MATSQEATGEAGCERPVQMLLRPFLRFDTTLLARDLAGINGSGRRLALVYTPRGFAHHSVELDAAGNRAVYKGSSARPAAVKISLCAERYAFIILKVTVTIIS